jgi:hypothetical protein
MKVIRRWFWHIHVALGHAVLDLDGTAYRVNNAHELHQHSVAGGLNNPSAVLGDFRVHKGTSMGLELAQSGAPLISSHQAAVSYHICSKDGRDLRSRRSVRTVGPRNMS